MSQCIIGDVVQWANSHHVPRSIPVPTSAFPNWRKYVGGFFSFYIKGPLRKVWIPKHPFSLKFKFFVKKRLSTSSNHSHESTLPCFFRTFLSLSPDPKHHCVNRITPSDLHIRLYDSSAYRNHHGLRQREKYLLAVEEPIVSLVFLYYTPAHRKEWGCWKVNCILWVSHRIEKTLKYSLQCYFWAIVYILSCCGSPAGMPADDFSVGFYFILPAECPASLSLALWYTLGLFRISISDKMKWSQTVIGSHTQARLLHQNKHKWIINTIFTARL